MKTFEECVKEQEDKYGFKKNMKVTVKDSAPHHPGVSGIFNFFGGPTASVAFIEIERQGSVRANICVSPDDLVKKQCVKKKVFKLIEEEIVIEIPDGYVLVDENYTGRLEKDEMVLVHNDTLIGGYVASWCFKSFREWVNVTESCVIKKIK
jgi:hypothetical protein